MGDVHWKMVDIHLVTAGIDHVMTYLTWRYKLYQSLCKPILWPERKRVRDRAAVRMFLLEPVTASVAAEAKDHVGSVHLAVHSNTAAVTEVAHYQPRIP
jgi:hypothetical protein